MNRMIKAKMLPPGKACCPNTDQATPHSKQTPVSNDNIQCKQGLKETRLHTTVNKHM